MRILCDYLSSIGSSPSPRDVSPDAGIGSFLSKRSPAYLGTTARFLLRPEMKRNFDNLTEAVRRGGVAPAGDNDIADENPIWVEFAASMGR
jgi:hypothetical protein